MPFDFGHNIWVEEANISIIKRELRLALKSKNPKKAVESVLKDGVINGLISGYKISIQQGHFAPTRLKIDLISNSGKIYCWYN